MLAVRSNGRSYEDVLDAMYDSITPSFGNNGDPTDEEVRQEALAIREIVELRGREMGLDAAVIARLRRDVPWQFIMRRAYELDER